MIFDFVLTKWNINYIEVFNVFIFPFCLGLTMWNINVNSRSIGLVGSNCLGLTMWNINYYKMYYILETEKFRFN